MSPTRTKNHGKPAALLKQHDCRTAIYGVNFTTGTLLHNSKARPQSMEEEIQREATEAATQLLTPMFTSAPPKRLLTQQ
jgi:hypothetical protein